MSRIRKDTIGNRQDEATQENDLSDVSWDVRRVGVGFLVLLLLFLLGLIFLPQIKSAILDQSSKVLGVSFSKPEQNLDPPDAKEAEKILNDAKEEINKLTADNLTSSSSALNNIIRSLQQLQKGDMDAKEAICEHLCKPK